MTKMKLNLLRIAKWTVLLVGLGIMLAGCQSAEKAAGNLVGKMTGSHKDSAMHDKEMQSAPPQANVDATGESEVQIVIENFVFSPAEVTVTPGTKVTWINKDEAPHTATSIDKKFNSGGLDTDDKFSFVFNDKGDYPYFCTLHPQMKATIKVQ
jgi:plastocyanin